MRSGGGCGAEGDAGSSAALPAPLSVPGACAEAAAGMGPAAEQRLRAALRPPGASPRPPSASPGCFIGVTQQYPGTLPAPRCARLSFGACYCARWRSGPVPPRPRPPLTSPRQYLAFRKGKRPALLPAPSPPAAGFGRRQASGRGCPQSSPGPAPLSGLGGQETGGRGSLCSSAGSFVGPFEQRGRSGCGVRAAVGAPRSSHAAGTCSLPGSVWEKHACSACPGRRYPGASPSVEGKQSIKRKIVCVRVSATS
ncbi:forkhead box protein D1-like [Corvus cornix cornix]|uniref:forkhead box protein D1-like n=1 Tax=Corvus cornix cornix TaxID=932674 RepID=UPI00194E4D95|nr:forkhead box protein D1-like [Corvus cornix cornix]